MKFWLWFGALSVAVGGATALALSRGGRVIGLPTNAQFTVQFVTPKDPQAFARSFSGYQFFWSGQNAWGKPELLKRILDSSAPELARRRALLPADASSHAGDKYSKQAFYWPKYHAAAIGVPAQTVQVVIDEYGRLYDLDYSQRGALAGLWANPLFQAVLMAALAASGYGAVAYAAYAAYNMRGRELTLKNVALQSARAYAVSQCGQLCGTAFDMGVGIASGQSVDAAAVAAFEGQLSPEQRAVYANGKRVYASARA